MLLLRWIATNLLLSRLFGSGRRGRRTGRAGFFGPFPYYQSRALVLQNTAAGRDS
jgi:hypothetical protein